MDKVNYGKYSKADELLEDKEVTTNKKIETKTDKNPEVDKPKEKQKTAKVCDCHRLNIRKKPNKSSEVICIVNLGTKLIIGEAVDNDWIEVYDKKGVVIEGYVMRHYISEV